MQKMPGSHFKTVRHCSIIYIILWNTSCAIWKYRIRLQASTMVVMKGVAMMAGELADTMQMCGAHSLAEITPDMVRV